MAGEIADIGYSVPEDVKAAVDEAEQMVFDVAERRTADTMRPLRELLGAGLDRIEELGQRGSEITGVATGYHELDRDPVGLPAVVAEHRRGPSRHGQDAASRSGVLAHVGLEVQRPALLFSLEMGHLELTQRLLASEAEVERAAPRRRGGSATQDWSKIGMAVTPAVRARRSSSTTTRTRP